MHWLRMDVCTAGSRPGGRWSRSKSGEAGGTRHLRRHPRRNVVFRNHLESQRCLDTDCA